ncbi:MAG: hypothetical protein AB7G15_02605 [Alphaproteobacteria bacterium]
MRKHAPPPVAHPSASYRREGDTVLIELSLHNVAQLYNSFDPSPFFDKELDLQADLYILGAVRDIGADKPFKLILELPRSEIKAEDASAVERSIRNHFAYRLQTARRDLRLDYRRGRTSLMIGLAFLAACLGLREIGLSLDPSTAGRILSESLLIVGWVAMWGPLDFFLYGWWSKVGTCRILERLALVDVELRHK